MKNKIILLITSLILSLSFTTLAHAATSPHIDSSPSDNEWSDGEEDATTSKDATNSCQITYQCKMPENFNLASYVTIYNKESEDLYRLIATASNNYNSRIYVPAGDYEISECGILNDSANKYPMVKPADFTITANDFHLIESTLVNYETIESEAERRMSGIKEEAKKDETPKTDTLKATTKEESSSILPWRLHTVPYWYSCFLWNNCLHCHFLSVITKRKTL